MAALKYKQQENESISRIIKLSNIKLCNNYANGCGQLTLLWNQIHPVCFL